MTIYCDVDYCENNEDGFCLSDKLHINENGECTVICGLEDNSLTDVESE